LPVPIDLERLAASDQVLRKADPLTLKYIEDKPRGNKLLHLLPARLPACSGPYPKS
jgi:hypothetical protein